jgi:predicted TIM-barrel fold metal-dependent hydrolase
MHSSGRALFAVVFAVTCVAQTRPPKLVDAHVHHNGSTDFLSKFAARLRTEEATALLITAPKDLAQVSRFMEQNPGVFAGMGQISLDAPDVLETIDRFHSAGFRGLGEITGPKFAYDDRRYWPIYERAEAYGMILLFHTGIVNRTSPDVASDVSSDRMRVGTLELIARRFPKLAIIAAHLGNPDYAWAAELGRWNPNLYFDLSGSTLIKKEQDYNFFRSLFWWTATTGPHSPKSGASAFEKIVFGSDVFDGEIEEFDRALTRYRRMLDTCGVPPEAQANIFSGTMRRLLNR